MANDKNCKPCSGEKTTVCTTTEKWGSAACDIKPGTRLYVGGRYMFKFADPLAWNRSKPYEALVIVMHDNYTYASKKAVPPNVDISNEDYWLLISNPNAQFEQLRQLVVQYQADVASLENQVAEFETETEQNFEAVNTRIDNVPAEEKIVIIGDSWSNPESWGMRWVELFRTATNAELFNYAKSGAGFLRTSTASRPDFPTQLEQAITAIQDPSTITKVLIIGGTNDWRDGVTTAQPYIEVINSMLARIGEVFANASTHVFFMQGTPNREYPYELIRGVQMGCDAHVINAAWPIPFTEFADELHLTYDGYRRWCKFVLASLYGGTYTVGTPVHSFAESIRAVNPDDPDIVVERADVWAEWDERVIRVYYDVYITVPEGKSVVAWVKLDNSGNLGLPIYTGYRSFINLYGNNDTPLLVGFRKTVNSSTGKQTFTDMAINTLARQVKTAIYTGCIQYVVPDPAFTQL